MPKSTLLLLSLALITLSNTWHSYAAKISYKNNRILITGEIFNGDFEKFTKALKHMEKKKKKKRIYGVRTRSRLSSNEPTIVYLKSNGGIVLDAIKIGLTINKLKFRTYAHNGKCYSACGLIWLAGHRRFIHPKAKVGFHTTYNPNTKRSAGSNAMVGVYLANIGYSYETAQYVAEASPRRMNVLSLKKKYYKGISYFVEALPQYGGPPNRVPPPDLDPRKRFDLLADGSLYEGELEKGVPNGFGTKVFKNGHEYEGNWLSGTMHGYGILIEKSGQKYEGTWKNNKRHGFFEVLFNGQIKHTFWQNDKLLVSNTYKRSKNWYSEVAVVTSRILASQIRARIEKTYKDILGDRKVSMDIFTKRKNGSVKNTYKLRYSTYTREHAWYVCQQLRKFGETCTVVQK